MKLSIRDSELFYRLHFAILCHTNRRLKLYPGAETSESIRALPAADVLAIRNALWEHPELLESFVTENTFHLSSEEMELVASWRHRITGQFILISHLKNYSVFMKADEQAYGVIGLSDDIETVSGRDLPTIVETVLLPFKGQIIYDGLISSYNVHFGKEIRARFRNAYQESKAKYGIVTSLPFSSESTDQNDEELLKFYLKGEHNRERYLRQIPELVRKKASLLILYHQEMGKIHARQLRKSYRAAGIDKGWIAVMEGLVVGIGSTRDEAEQAAKKIVPPEKHDWMTVSKWGSR